MTVRLRPRRPDETFPYWFDNTKLIAVNTCPTWGVVRYGLGKTPSVANPIRATPLEAGAAMHNVFAVVRLLDMLENGGEFYDTFNEELIHTKGIELFGGGAWERAHGYFTRPGAWRTRVVDTALAILESSGYRDDPEDRRRTLSNMEEAAIVYIDRYEWGRWMPVLRPSIGLFGVEHPFDLVIEHTEELGEDGVGNVQQQRQRARRRFIGRIDALVFDRTHDCYAIHENKTAGRIDRAWHAQWDTSQQITGYILAAETLLNGSTRVPSATVFGLALPVPKTFDYGGCVRIPVTRSDTQRVEWFEWFRHTAELFEAYLPMPERAPKYTHSCSRYFRPCPLLAFCCLPRHERVEALAEMATDVWNPLDDAEAPAAP